MGHDSYSKNKNPTDYSATYLITETSRINFKNSLPELPSEEKKSYPSSIGVESIRVSTEIDYTTKFDPKPTPDG